SGAVYVYTHDAESDLFVLQQRLQDPTPAYGESFGYEVAIDGCDLVVATYTVVFYSEYDTETGVWAEPVMITPRADHASLYNSHITLSNRWLAIGYNTGDKTNHVLVYTLTLDGWPTLDPLFTLSPPDLLEDTHYGMSLSIDMDGTSVSNLTSGWLVVGERLADVDGVEHAGKVHVYQWVDTGIGGSFVHYTTLSQTTPQDTVTFGQNIVLSQGVLAITAEDDAQSVTRYECYSDTLEAQAEGECVWTQTSVIKARYGEWGGFGDGLAVYGGGIYVGSELTHGYDANGRYLSARAGSVYLTSTVNVSEDTADLVLVYSDAIPGVVTGSLALYSDQGALVGTGPDTLMGWDGETPTADGIDTHLGKYLIESTLPDVTETPAVLDLYVNDRPFASVDTDHFIYRDNLSDALPMTMGTCEQTYVPFSLFTSGGYLVYEDVSDYLSAGWESGVIPNDGVSLTYADSGFYSLSVTAPATTATHTLTLSILDDIVLSVSGVDVSPTVDPLASDVTCPMFAILGERFQIEIDPVDGCGVPLEQYTVDITIRDYMSDVVASVSMVVEEGVFVHDLQIDIEGAYSVQAEVNDTIVAQGLALFVSIMTVEVDGVTYPVAASESEYLSLPDSVTVNHTLPVRVAVNDVIHSAIPDMGERMQLLVTDRSNGSQTVYDMEYQGNDGGYDTHNVYECDIYPSYKGEFTLTVTIDGDTLLASIVEVRGSIVPYVIGAVVLCALIGCGIWWYMRRKRYAHRHQLLANEEDHA
ncbi:hypothetical protein KIPB_007772, partial [Kipferlia bialata]